MNPITKEILNTEIVQHQITLKELQFQQNVYPLRPKEYQSLHYEITKKQLRLNQLTYKRDLLC